MSSTEALERDTRRDPEQPSSSQQTWTVYCAHMQGSDPNELTLLHHNPVRWVKSIISIVWMRNWSQRGLGNLPETTQLVISLVSVRAGIQTRGPPGDLPNPGIKPTCLMSAALIRGFFTTSAGWEAHVIYLASKASFSTNFSLSLSTGEEWSSKLDLFLKSLFNVSPSLAISTSLAKRC